MASVAILCIVVAAQSAAEPQERVFAIDVQSRKATGITQPLRAQRGDTVILRWSTDEPLHLHLHGYDLEVELTPGTPAELSFTAYATGRFPMTIHGSGGHDETVLVYLEILP